MLDTLLAQSSLPNLHPALVHTPLALLPVAFCFDLACLAARRQLWLERAATALYVIGALGAVVAFISGQRAAEAMLGIPGAAQAAMYDHEDMAKLALILAAVAAVLRLVVSWRGRHDREVAVGPLRLIAVAVAAAALALLVVAADRGGALVYRHGLGVVAGQTVHDRAEPEDEEFLEP